MADQKSKKVMDVAKPEEAEVEIGSKPMIVGHKSLASDPMVREESQDSEKQGEKVKEEATEEKVELAPPSEKQKTIEPLKTAVTDEKQPADEKKSTDNQTTETVESSKDSNSDTSVSGDSENDSSEKETEEIKKLDPTAEALEREDKARKLIESKKYNVNIKQSRGSQRRLVWILATLLIAGFASLYLLIDSGKLDLGISLPFHIFEQKQVNPSQSAPISAEEKTAAPSTKDTSASEMSNLLSDFKFSIDENTGWVYKNTSSYLESQAATLGLTITTASKAKATLYTVWGKGGQCEPRTTDKPHAGDNLCNTYEEIGRIENDSGYLVKVKFSTAITQTEAGTTTYNYCYRPKFNSAGQPVQDYGKGPRMGFELPCEPDDIFVEFEDTTDNSTSSFFDAAEVKEIAANLLTIKYNNQ